MSLASKPPVALIAGPTASGKSTLALALAEAANGVIVNADSSQIYADLPILSAAPTESDLQRAEHRLYGIEDGAAGMSAVEWATLAKHEIATIHDSGRLPILVGGNGLYLKILMDGIAPVPAIDPDIRRQVREAPLATNRRLLFQHDFEAASRLDPSDTTRIARALEVMLSTGRPLAAWHQERTGGIYEQISLLPLVLLPPRSWIYARCDGRFQQMVEDGAVEEVERLLARGLPPSLPVMQAIGVRELAVFLNGSATLEEATAMGQQATRNYAKRQYTWFANQPPVHWLRFNDPLGPSTIAAALELLRPKD
jgi:tRNA dimethylallyltransferase